MLNNIATGGCMAKTILVLNGSPHKKGNVCNALKTRVEKLSKVQNTAYVGRGGLLNPGRWSAPGKESLKWQKSAYVPLVACVYFPAWSGTNPLQMPGLYPAAAMTWGRRQ